MLCNLALSFLFMTWDKDTYWQVLAYSEGLNSKIEAYLTNNSDCKSYGIGYDYI
ncbi:hypothetical protein SAMN05444394_4059 [Algoriphagus halophilus]|uniref:Uncharacterized protein n=1 Tax=Algoriphagus halophilus TaxID=226505 RepID=A0A1N6HVT7_9BACT|nr:hypothetical protein SAMN05444394_4059 [Algoriphagus halophilus]